MRDDDLAFRTMVDFHLPAAGRNVGAIRLRGFAILGFLDADGALFDPGWRQAVVVNNAGMCCTMKTGAPRSAGSAGSSLPSAPGPPVDTPISTSGGPVRGILRSEIAARRRCRIESRQARLGDYRRAGWQRISRRRSNARTSGCRRARRWARFAAVVPPSGLVMKSNAPNSSARTVISPPRTVRELSMITPAFDPAARHRLQRLQYRSSPASRYRA